MVITINEKLYRARAEVARAIAHPIRLEIIDILHGEEELCVQEITEMVAASQSSISKHLGILKDAGILARRKEGLNSYYQLRTPCLASIFNCLDDILREKLKRSRSELDLLEG